MSINVLHGVGSLLGESFYNIYLHSLADGHKIIPSENKTSTQEGAWFFDCSHGLNDTGWSARWQQIGQPPL